MPVTGGVEDAGHAKLRRGLQAMAIVLVQGRHSPRTKQTRRAVWQHFDFAFNAVDRFQVVFVAHDCFGVGVDECVVQREAHILARR